MALQILQFEFQFQFSIRLYRQRTLVRLAVAFAVAYVVVAATQSPIHQSASHINQNTRGLLNTLPTATRTGNGDCHSDYTTNDDDDECSHISLSCSHCNSVGTFDRVIVNHPLIGIAWTSLLSLRVVVFVVVFIVVASHHPYFEYSSQLEHRA